MVFLISSLNGLTDIPMEMGLYTWSNTSSKSRIDQFLFSPILADPYTLSSQKGCLEYYQIIFLFFFFLGGGESMERENSFLV